MISDYKIKNSKKHDDKTQHDTITAILLLIGTYLMSTYIPKDGITGNYMLDSGTSLFTLLLMIIVLIVVLILVKNTFFSKKIVEIKNVRPRRKGKSKRRK
jgi:hypothetical protein